MYRHARVNMTLWLERYVKEIYPDWVRTGTSLPDLAAIAAERDLVLTHSTVQSVSTAEVPKGALSPSSDSALRKTTSVSRKCTLSKAGLQLLAKPISLATNISHPYAGVSKDAFPQASNRATVKASIKSKPSLLKLVLSHGMAANRSASNKLLFPSTADAKNNPRSHQASALMKRNGGAESSLSTSSIVHQPATVDAKPAIVIDLTGETSEPVSRKRKRSLVAKEEKVDLNSLQPQCRPSTKRRHAKTAVKLEGKGTSEEPYIL